MATYTKLKSGEWGVRVEGKPTTGCRITVMTKSGASKVETIGKVLWSGNGVSLCTIVPANITKTPAATDERGGRKEVERTYKRRYGWDGGRGSSSYYTRGMYDEES